MASLLEVVNRADEADLLRCCGSARWVREVRAQRPFRSLDEVEEVSAAVLATLDWTEVVPLLEQVTRVRRRWPDLGRGELIYEHRFGHPFVLCADQMTRAAVLARLRHRSGNGRAAERAEAVAELAKVVAVRLRGLVL
ncbi:2-oxo-4-hydroxy-4-carboxy-5-ureidoimidazoline decarboxylase [Actinokineospora baliensis]|uniref:2-oxo-4-hydroxy-4-carboxy-5-ureidoimidazoline decarboxylase n=1 Tax=Actinokineospora baliensis TaxID=547056 RepID=UPI00195D35B5|nr:2-oxo-4-hydroxy-4-carboxy-5-ureidoimidazoline decarboxylase [Actinokineospora baliensis]MBM7776203.1 2-oxo-4-hydroxy-4-carboxy-5-ureidoimidazoline decarboxylase [Actinokineospora baliensis]